MRGMKNKVLSSGYGMLLNGMQVIEQNGTPKTKCNKEFLISDGGLNRPTLTLARMGMVAPGRCQERQIFGRAD